MGNDKFDHAMDHPWNISISLPLKGDKPYQGFAVLYDSLLGNRMLPVFTRNFDHLVNKYKICFQTTADVACGTGGFVKHLCKWRVPVFGIDRSGAMLSIARRRNRGNGAKFLQQDMRYLKLPHPVDIITCNFDSLNYLINSEDLFRAFRSFYTNLTNGGYLIFDVITDVKKGAHPREFRRHFWGPGIRSFWWILWNPQLQLRTVIMTNLITECDHSWWQEQEVHYQRNHPVRQIVSVLNGCGFRVRGIHDAYFLFSPAKYTGRAVFVAQK